MADTTIILSGPGRRKTGYNEVYGTVDLTTSASAITLKIDDTSEGITVLRADAAWFFSKTNSGATDVWYPVAAGEGYPWEHDTTADVVYAKTASGTTTVRVLRVNESGAAGGGGGGTGGGGGSGGPVTITGPLDSQAAAASVSVATSTEDRALLTGGAQRTGITDGVNLVGVSTTSANGSTLTDNRLKVSAHVKALNAAATGWDMIISGITSPVSTVLGFLNILPFGTYRVSPTALTDGQSGNVTLNSTGAMRVTDINIPVVGTAADVASVPVAFSTEGKAQLGSLTETAPANDTASSGLNGRLQRIAQRFTTFLAIFKAEDSASADGDLAMPVLSIQKATPVDTGGTDGDYVMPQMSGGRTWIQWITGQAAPITRSVMSLANAITVTASSAYTAGNSIGGLITFTNVVTATSTTGELRSLRFNMKSAQTFPIDIYLFNANPVASTFTDKVTPAINVADFDKIIGVFSLTVAKSGLGTHTIYGLENMGRNFTIPSGTSMYAVAVVPVGSAVVPIFTASTDVSTTVNLMLD